MPSPSVIHVEHSSGQALNRVHVTPVDGRPRTRHPVFIRDARDQFPSRSSDAYVVVRSQEMESPEMPGRFILSLGRTSYSQMLALNCQACTSRSSLP